ncbi:hypothetical protein [Imtechella halotolerans]|uniref:Pore-forming protein n=1 Tax=Imtechella halotolerans K1 TaxID=946077 RepID=I0WHX3_9FLAO|nr:hypothetical protein [Imtechella halotolerans]EID75989.1 hypothetical protein W5A_03564 [Imtechella halotolerans K1]WMQ63180.1 hypothetical protein PT603_12680 [Imtechella halotolerans]
MKRIKYKNKFLNTQLFLGFMWIAIAFLIDYNSKIDYISLLISLMYLGNYSYLRINQYITINNNILTVNGFRKKTIKLNEIKQIKKFAGDYIIYGNKEKITIDTEVIERVSLKCLQRELENYPINWV